MKIKFWGVRGSIPCPGPETVGYGGNTTCLEVRFPQADRLAIIDAGSGIRALGGYLLRHDLARGLKHLDVFLTHTHWDHILGLPFFIPMYIPGMTIRIHGPATFEDNSLEKVVTGQFEYRYFPVRVEELASAIEYVALGEESLDLGDGIALTTKYLNHPVGCLGYRFEHRGKSLVTVFDMEPFQNLFAADPTDPGFDPAIAGEGEQAAAEQNRLVERFYAGADLVVHDAQYTLEEYLTGRIGWGHSAMEEVVEAAGRNRVRNLALTHHDPDRTDEQLDALSASLCHPDAGNAANAFFAREGLEIDLQADQRRTA